MSIRARLLVATVALVALGLIAANAATYAFLRSSLIQRVDRQLEGARVEALRVLLESSSRFPGAPILGLRRGSSDAPRATYAELRDSGGSVVAYESFGIGTVDAPPQLPQDLPGSEIAGQRGRSARIFTARATGEAGFRYRVLASPIANSGGTLVVAIPLTDVDATLRRLLFVEGVVTAAVLIAMAAVALWLVRIGLRPLESMSATADAIAEGDLSRRVEPADHRTEVGRLGLALNAMLARIETAFAERRASEDRLRRFVADASHELRTPLTSIRGYAELFRRGANARPDDLAKSMRRIEGESERMGNLVDELLLLAHLDQGRPLAREQVDLVRMATEVVEDARLISADHPIELDAPPTLAVEGDDARLRQVMSNLVANAVVHTPAGTIVHVKLEENASSALLEVADEGPGMSQDDSTRVFDRFYRVDPSRSRARGGAGLGLSIASAIVDAHGGSISLQTSPGGGAKFLVSIPIACSAEGPGKS